MPVFSASCSRVISEKKGQEEKERQTGDIRMGNKIKKRYVCGVRQQGERGVVSSRQSDRNQVKTQEKGNGGGQNEYSVTGSRKEGRRESTAPQLVSQVRKD